MEHRALDRVEAVARVEPAALPHKRLSRRARCERWARLLEREQQPLATIAGIDYGAPQVRQSRRADNSPLSVAYRDPVLRQAGLAGDAVGDAVAFFGLSWVELHGIACDCRHGAAVSPVLAASHVRMAARKAGGRSHPGRPAVLMAGASAIAAAALAFAAI